MGKVTGKVNPAGKSGQSRGFADLNADPATSVTVTNPTEKSGARSVSGQEGPVEIRFYRAAGQHGFLSNLFKWPVHFEGRVFSTAEHAYQFGKPKDSKVAEWIIAAPKPHLVAVGAHGLFAFDVRPDWNAIKVDRMRAVLRAKFTEPDLELALLDTGDAMLIEQSNTDAFWGIGRKGTGKNMLGTLLMELRSSLRTENDTPAAESPMLTVAEHTEVHERPGLTGLTVDELRARVNELERQVAPYTVHDTDDHREERAALCREYVAAGKPPRLNWLYQQAAHGRRTITELQADLDWLESAGMLDVLQGAFGNIPGVAKAKTLRAGIAAARKSVAAKEGRWENREADESNEVSNA